MAIPLVVNGVTFSFPQEGDTGYAGQVTSWADAITNGTLQLGGTYALDSELILTGFGVTAPYFVSGTASPAASAGVLRLGHGDSIGYRNVGDSANGLLTVGNSGNGFPNDELVFIPASGATGTLLSGQPFVMATGCATAFSTGAATLPAWTTTVTDTDGAFVGSTSTFTVPAGKGGQYACEAVLRFNTLTANTGTQFSTWLLAGAATDEQVFGVTFNGTDHSFRHSSTFTATAGQTISWKFSQSNAASRTPAVSAIDNRITIRRLA